VSFMSIALKLFFATLSANVSLTNCRCMPATPGVVD